MTATAKEIEFRAVVSPDRSSAELVLPPGLDLNHLTVDMCRALLSAQGVDINAQVLANLQALVANPPALDHMQRVPVASSIAPVDGKDGYVEWTIDHQHDINIQQAEAINFYQRSAYFTVKPGDELGIIHPPTDGTDGRDVLGKSIAAKPGKTAALKHDETIQVKDKGLLIANQQGILTRNGENAAIRQMIEIPEYVDFSTGNIDFTGEVVVHKGVRDLFVVKATGNITVKGLIEAATVVCGGDLFAEGGMAARSRGSVDVKGHLMARYLDNVRGEIKGDLKIEREAINCDLIIHGGIQAPAGMLIGGRMVVVGEIHIGCVGSAAGVATDLILGSVPSLEPFAHSLSDLMAELQKRKDEFAGEMKLLSAEGKRLTAHDKERQTELEFELYGIDQRIIRGQSVLDALNQRIHEHRTINLQAHRCIHCGTTIIIGENAFRMSRDLPGPVKIIKDSGDIVYRFSSGEGGLLAQVSEVSAAPAYITHAAELNPDPEI